MIKSINEVFDDFLGVKTGADEIDAIPDRKIFAIYGPTSYSVLENLFIKYPFEANDHLVDFGCGKGRVLIMAAYYSCKKITGYELNAKRYDLLLKNIECFRNKFESDSTILTFNMNAEKVIIDDTTNKFFFFNPFHLKVYIRVFNEIQASLQRSRRDVYLFLHSPDDSIIKYIDSLNMFKKIDLFECYNSLYSETKLIVYSN